MGLIQRFQFTAVAALLMAAFLSQACKGDGTIPVQVLSAENLNYYPKQKMLALAITIDLGKLDPYSGYRFSTSTVVEGRRIIVRVTGAPKSREPAPEHLLILRIKPLSAGIYNIVDGTTNKVVASVDTAKPSPFNAR